LIGDASKARTRLGWKPTVTFDELVESMVNADRELIQRQQIIQQSLSRHQRRGTV
jgi:GDPmannose 4,6-dehydratase